ncbi:hypothetical protein DXG03_004613 [Asterophora parasitica]|uniref:Uncharacterized protein n=1 Tax=Asterophora parasitica TaxID=117018 RepID=A0A9P7GA10_9AGAR|nr:hypothetical protein DXG03_004613 [Asterophora parasitica]
MPGFNKIRRVLHDVFEPDEAWNALDTFGLAFEIRENIISAAAKELEFSVLSMCSTNAGYTERIDETTAMINTEVRQLLAGGAPDDDEDAQNVVDVMKRLSKGHSRRAGKQRAA